MSTSNFLSPIEFRLSIARLPETVYYVQEANIPGLSASFAQQPTPFVTLPKAATKVEYEDLELVMIADEDLKGYREISDWITQLHFTESYDQYKALEESEYGIESDLTLTILNSHKNANVKVNFKNVFPYSISSIQLDTKESDVIAPTFNVSFKYDSYKIEV